MEETLTSKLDRSGNRLEADGGYTQGGSNGEKEEAERPVVEGRQAGQTSRETQMVLCAMHCVR